MNYLDWLLRATLWTLALSASAGVVISIICMLEASAITTRKLVRLGAACALAALLLWPAVKVVVYQ